MAYSSNEKACLWKNIEKQHFPDGFPAKKALCLQGIAC